MHRRGLSVTLLVVFALQLLGAMAFASVCLEPCPDDGADTSCPPVCALCTSCTHAQTAIVQHSASAVPFLSAMPFAPQSLGSPSLHLADDILHVPLLG